MAHLGITLQLLRENQLFVKLNKCEFWLLEVKFLGHVFFKEGVAVDPTKVEVVLDWRQPINVFESQIFFRLAGYYRRFV